MHIPKLQDDICTQNLGIWHHDSLRFINYTDENLINI